MKVFNKNNLYILLIVILFIIVILLLINKCSKYDNFETNSIGTNNVQLILFHSGLDICSDCLKFSEIGNKLNNTQIKNKTIIFKKVNCLCDDEENDCDEYKERCDEFNVDIYPTIYLLNDNNNRVIYENTIDQEKIKKWITKNIQ